MKRIDNYKYSNPNYCDPPGALRAILSHPYLGESKSIEQATFKEHRFAFYYWYRWWNKLQNVNQKPPTLISVDYHLDLAKPNISEENELLELDGISESDLAYFCWARMNSINNGHILKWNVGNPFFLWSISPDYIISNFFYAGDTNIPIFVTINRIFVIYFTHKIKSPRHSPENSFQEECNTKLIILILFFGTYKFTAFHFFIGAC